MTDEDRLKITVAADEAGLRQVSAACPNCGGPTRQDVVASVERWETDADHEIQVWEDWDTVRCRGCLGVSYRYAYRCTEEEEWDPHAQQSRLAERVSSFPEPHRSRPPLRNHQQLPPRVGRIYLETLKAVADDSRVLAGIGIRAIVESVCKEKAVSGSNLEQRIDGLVAAGLLPQPNAELLHGTRLLGNRSAHEAEPLTEEGLTAALQVTEHLLTTVYLIQLAASSLPRRGGGDP